MSASLPERLCPPAGTRLPLGYASAVRRATPFILAATSLALAAALLAAGCGGSDTVSKGDYAEAVVTARDRVDFALAQITVGRGTLEELLERMEAAADRIDDAASDLDDAGVAEGFEDETEDLVDTLHQFAADLSGLAHDAGQPGQEGLLTGTNALQFPSWTRLNRLLADLREQGIEVAPVGSH